MKNMRRTSFSANEPSESWPTQTQHPKDSLPTSCCCPSQSRMWIRGPVSAQHVEFAFGNGCDRPGYVGFALARFCMALQFRDCYIGIVRQKSIEHQTMKALTLSVLLGIVALAFVGCSSTSSSGGSAAPTISGYVDTSIGYQAK